MTGRRKRDGGEDRRELQADGKHPAPCARHCESTAYEIEIRQLKRALAESRADAATEKGRREHTQQWYAERLAKIEEVAKREGLWPEIAAIIANGSGTRQLPNGSYVYDPPTYAQKLNSAKHKAERAEARAERLAGFLRKAMSDLEAREADCENIDWLPWWNDARAELEQEPQE